MIFNVDTEELLHSSLEQYAAGMEHRLTLDQVEEITSLGLALARKIHKLII
jgi:hypothetical protein